MIVVISLVAVASSFFFSFTPSLKAAKGSRLRGKMFSEKAVIEHAPIFPGLLAFSLYSYVIMMMINLLYVIFGQLPHMLIIILLVWSREKWRTSVWSSSLPGEEPVREKDAFFLIVLWFPSDFFSADQDNDDVRRTIRVHTAHTFATSIIIIIPNKTVNREQRWKERWRKSATQSLCPSDLLLRTAQQTQHHFKCVKKNFSCQKKKEW